MVTKSNIIISPILLNDSIIEKVKKVICISVAEGTRLVSLNLKDSGYTWIVRWKTEMERERKISQFNKLTCARKPVVKLYHSFLQLTYTIF